MFGRFGGDFWQCFLRHVFLTPRQYNKKPVKFDQGLDFLKVWRGKSKKTIGKTKENKENTVKSRNFRALFSYSYFWVYFMFFKIPGEEHYGSQRLPGKSFLEDVWEIVWRCLAGNKENNPMNR